MSGAADKDFAKLSAELAKIEYLWNKKNEIEIQKDEEKRKQSCAKIAEILECIVRKQIFQRASDDNAELIGKCLQLCYYITKNKRNRLKMASSGFLPATLKVFQSFVKICKASSKIDATYLINIRVCVLAAGFLRLLARTKCGREQLVTCNALETFKQAVYDRLECESDTNEAKELNSLICSLCVRCLTMKPLPVPREYPITFVLPETDAACRCPAEDASESDEDNVIEIGPGPDVSEVLAARLMSSRSLDDEPPKHPSFVAAQQSVIAELAAATSAPAEPLVAKSAVQPPTTTDDVPSAADVVCAAKATLAVDVPPPLAESSVLPMMTPAGSGTQSRPIVPPLINVPPAVAQPIFSLDSLRCKCDDAADLGAYKKFCAEYGDEVKLVPVIQDERLKRHSSIHALINSPNIEHLYNDEAFRPSLRRSSRSTIDMVKRLELNRLTTKNRCSSELKFNKEWRRRRNESDPHPESIGTSPERGLRYKLLDGSLGQAPEMSYGDDTGCIVPPERRKNYFYDQKTFTDMTKNTKRVVPFKKMAYPDFIGVHPDTPLQPLNKNHKAILRATLQEIDRDKNGTDFEARTVYDLDDLVKNEREPAELTNDDEERAGTLDPNVDHLKFESRFECGNLRKVIQVGPREYELILSNDINQMLQHYMWYYFEVSNLEENVPYVFKIINFVKSKSLVTSGMQPCTLSVVESVRGRAGWSRCGRDLVYYRNNYNRPLSSIGNASSKRQTERCYNTNSFTMSFQHRGDIVYVAFHYPYTFTGLRANLSRWQKLMAVYNKTCPKKEAILYRKEVLTNTLSGNAVHVVTITAAGTPSEIAARDVVFLTSRVHPGEANASWMVHGTIELLLSNEPEAQKAREAFVFKIVPMLNPDGVVNGSHRCSLAGQDLNRQWLAPNPALHPSIYHTKNLLLYLCSVGKKPLVFCDYHGHSRKMNVFVYGNNPKCSWLKHDRNMEHNYEFYLLPELLDDIAPPFRLTYSSFQIQKGKEASARVNAWREMGIARAYTMEASYGGFTRGLYCESHLGTYDLISMGRYLVVGVAKLREYIDAGKQPTLRFEAAIGESEDSGMA